MSLSPTQPSASLGKRPRTLDDVPGWLYPADRLLFEWFLARQNARQMPGDLLELGVFQGKSAIVLAGYLRPGDVMTVCDLFELVIDDTSVRLGMSGAYHTLTQAVFERNFLAFHDQLPVIVKGRTDVITEHVAAASCRFVHVDASHLYQHVHTDLLSARKLLREDGLVVLDDYRAEHTPGTAAAVWEAVAVDGLNVVCVSGNKFYGTWSDPTEVQDDLIAHIATLTEYRCHQQDVLGRRLLRVARAANVPAPRTGSPWRRAAKAILPPVVTAAIRRSRRAI